MLAYVNKQGGPCTDLCQLTQDPPLDGDTQSTSQRDSREAEHHHGGSAEPQQSDYTDGVVVSTLDVWQGMQSLQEAHGRPLRDQEESEASNLCV